MTNGELMSAGGEHGDLMTGRLDSELTHWPRSNCITFWTTHGNREL